MAAGRWVGRGDKNGADGVAVNAMRTMISTVGMTGVVVIGEGEKDNAPMLFNGEEVGDGTGPECDVAVDPIDGTTLTAKGMSNAVAVLAVARAARCTTLRGVLHGEAGHRPEAADVVDIRYPVRENIHQVAKAKGIAPRTSPSSARPARGTRARRRDPGHRRADQVHRRRRRRRRDHGRPPDTGIDLLLGIGGTPEGIIAACAMKCVGGVIQGRLWPKDDDERQRALDAGHDLDPTTSSRPTTWSPATTASSWPPASPTAS
jgi:fructose-1,6-bisphosphatase II